MSKYLELLRGQIDDLCEKRDGYIDAMDDVAAAVSADETRSTPSPEEQALLNEARSALYGVKDDDTKPGLLAEIEALEARAAEIEKLGEARKNRPEATRRAPVPGTKDTDVYDIDLRSAPRNAETVRDISSRARRAVEAERSLTDAHKESIERLFERDREGAVARHIIATGRPEYRSAFAKLTTMAQPWLTEAEARAIEEVRAINITTDASGGYLMPFTLDPTIILTNAGTINPMRRLASVRTVLTDNWQGITSAGVTASWDAEGDEVSDDAPTDLAQPSIPVRNPQAWIEFTRQAEDDFANLATDCSVMLFDAKDRLEGAGFTTGSGSSNQPTGIVTGLVAASKTVSSATTDTYAVADVYATQDALPARYEQGATWQISKPIINKTRQFGSAVGHAFLVDLGGGQPSQLLGDDLYKNSDLDSTITATAHNYIAVYGNIAQAYRINDRIGMSIELVPHTFGPNGRPNGKRGWYARWRVGAGMLNADAARVLNVT